jgi:hypothetical protein
MYPESEFFLRFWHPIFEDSVDLHPNQLQLASNGTICFDVEFKQKRKQFVGKSNILYPTNAIFGVSLYGKTENKDGQSCIKPCGVIQPEILLEDLSDAGKEYKRRDGEFLSRHEMMEYEDAVKGAQFSSKARFIQIVIRCVSMRDLHLIPDKNNKNPLIQSPKLFQACMKRLISIHYTPTFLHHRKPHPPKISGYFSAQYTTSNGDVLPLSSYMIRSRMRDTRLPDFRELLYMLDNGIDQHPEIGGKSAFVQIANVYLDSNLQDKDPSKGDAILRMKWFACMIMAVEVTCAYNHAVPYIMDMERIGISPRAGTSYGKLCHVGTPGKPYLEVERMVDAEKDYGHDCEDSSMNADLRKRALDMHYLKSRGLWDTIHPRLRTLARIYNLFRVAVTQMYCGGEDDSTIEDRGGIFHFSALVIPRMYFRRMQQNGNTDADDMSPITGDKVREWEHMYKTRTKQGHPQDTMCQLGVMYAEGTNTICAAQFLYDPKMDSAHMHTDQFVVNASKHMSDMKNWVNVYHANVYSRSSTSLSTFYKHAISCFVGDAPGERKYVYDFLFTDTRTPNTFGVSVEDLASGHDAIALVPIMRYNDEELDALESNFTFRAPVYGVHESIRSASDKDIKELESYKPYKEITAADVSHIIGAPSTHPDDDSHFYYVRYTPLQADMEVHKRRDHFIRTMRAITSSFADRISGVQVKDNFIKTVPMDPIFLDGQLPLRSISVIIFLRKR